MFCGILQATLETILRKLWSNSSTKIRTKIRETMQILRGGRKCSSRCSTTNSPGMGLCLCRMTTSRMHLPKSHIARMPSTRSTNNPSCSVKRKSCAATGRARMVSDTRTCSSNSTPKPPGTLQAASSVGSSTCGTPTTGRQTLGCTKKSTTTWTTGRHGATTLCPTCATMWKKTVTSPNKNSCMKSKTGTGMTKCNLSSETPN
mmetsp:Transcript_68520/g.147896  ORF Transcript_68520/g.147896 Transcript_68520/m.147896 type:complete len:203 (-) Transcript_68520:119-727(-)